jgi:hypothetical protein
MAIEGTLQALLAPLAAGGCYPIVNTSADVTLPYITYMVVSNVPTVSLTGPSGLYNRHVQIDVFAESYKAAKDIEIAIKAAMASSTTIKNVPLMAQDLYEEEVDTYRVILEFSIWSE